MLLTNNTRQLMKFYLSLPLLFCLVFGLQAQNETNWHLMDAEQDGICGTSVYKAHKSLLKNKQAKKTVIVAVLDSGIDIEHEDLKGKIWVNEDEIAGNGIDDDKNGYIDDVNGWNFLGNPNGGMVLGDNLEFVRMMAKLEQKSNRSSEEEAQLKSLRKKYNADYSSAKEEFEGFQQISELYTKVNGVLSQYFGKEDYTKAEVENINSTDDNIALVKEVWLEMNDQGLTAAMIEEGQNYFKSSLEFHLNKEFNSREIIGDDYSNLKEIGYGNNQVNAPDSDHGTHVAGIIGAIRGNNLGVDGQADNVLIMPVRLVPNGDEHDKDVANGIRYAADNGADIINMSFGKSYSPNPELVLEAIKYAGEKGVLMVHGAGNDAENNDLHENYPRDAMKGSPSLPYWLDVGASDEIKGEKLLGSFSNYGRETVDIFAPGVQINSTVPDNNYAKFDGTSMASPVVAGVAALVWSYYPDLSVSELKDILLKSSESYAKLKVYRPSEGKGKKTKFKKLCLSGGIVNAYRALLLAEKRSK